MSKRFWRILIISITVVLLAVLFATDYWVSHTTRNQVYSDVNKIPKNRVGLLLGTSKYISKGIINPWYQNRIDAAVELYNAGKIEFIIVSGDNSTKYYNEPETMKRDLVARGVSPGCIFMDYAGLRTLDSILRCRDIFGVSRITIISQLFHNQRAIYIANNKKVVAIGYNAKDGNFALFDVFVREKLARVKMMLDLLLNKQAKAFYGEKIEVK